MRRKANDIPAGAGTGWTCVGGGAASHELAATGLRGVAIDRREPSTGPVVGAAEPAAAAMAGSAVQTAPYGTAVVGTGTEVWISVPADLVDIQTLKLVHGGTEFFTAFSPQPGTVAKTTWPGMVIVGEIDEVKIQTGAGEDIAVGDFDPTLPDPGP